MAAWRPRAAWRTSSIRSASESDPASASSGALLAAAGLSGVAARAIDVPTWFRDFDDYWSPFLGGQGPAPTYAMSLPEDRRIALREAIRRILPVAPDGSIRLSARAWAVRGFKAGAADPA